MKKTEIKYNTREFLKMAIEENEQLKRKIIDNQRKIRELIIVSLESQGFKENVIEKTNLSTDLKYFIHEEE